MSQGPDRHQPLSGGLTRAELERRIRTLEKENLQFRKALEEQNKDRIAYLQQAAEELAATLLKKRDQRINALEAENRELNLTIQQSNKERIDYLQNVAHQLVAPLNAIKWHIENLTGGHMSVERSKKVLRSIYSQATIAVHLAKNFALMSNLEADHTLKNLKEPVERVDLYRLLVNLADDFQPQGWDKSVEIGVDRNVERAPNVLVIKSLVTQVFSNIIENAIKYSDVDTSIRIDADFDSQDVTVSIRNRGIPIAKKDRQAVFERGYRSEDATNMHPAGTGFGLFIAKKIVDIHEGDIKGLTDERGDTVFQVTLESE